MSSSGRVNDIVSVEEIGFAHIFRGGFLYVNPEARQILV
jgi:hypothetical protein